jgi:hypothetical protein
MAPAAKKSVSKRKSIKTSAPGWSGAIFIDNSAILADKRGIYVVIENIYRARYGSLSCYPILRRSESREWRIMQKRWMDGAATGPAGNSPTPIGVYGLLSDR